MKLEKDKQIGFDSNVVFDGYNAKIDEANMHKLWDLLQDPYKNSIGAVVREYVSNSFDSHSEAAFIKNASLFEIRNEYPIYNNTTDEDLNILKTQMQRFDNNAVQVSINKDATGYYWATEDFGVGLSPERTKDVFCSYLKSTKEDTNNVIGAFGIGSKSGLSYNDVIFIRTRYNGIEYQYMLRKGEKSPRLDIISNVPTSEMNGTQIKVYIKDGPVESRYSRDIEPETWRFKNECVKQLAYFDNVYFNEQIFISNNYTIAQGENWIKSSNGNPFKGLHLCLGKVAYPIDWDALGMESIDLEVAIKFEIGELDIIQTREDVKYTPRTKKAILDKIELLKVELKAKWESDNEYETDDLLKYIENRKADPLLTYTLDTWSFSLVLKKLFIENEIPSWEFLPFKQIGFDARNISKTGIFIDYSVPSYINDSGLKHRFTDVFRALSKEHTDSSVYRIAGNHETKKSKYIKYELESTHSLYYLLRKQKPKLKQYIQYLELKNYSKSEWRTIIQTFQKEVEKCVIANTKSYNKVEIDKEWLIAQRSSTKRVFDNTVFNTYQYDKGSYGGGAWKATKLKKGQVDRNVNTLFIAGYKEHKETLLDIGNIYESVHENLRIGNKFLKVLYVAKSNTQYMMDAKNLITLNDYKKQKIFANVCTAHYLNTQYENNVLSDMLRFKDDTNIAIASLNVELYTNFNKVSNFMKKYNISTNTNSEFFKDVYKYVVENNLLNKEIINSAEFVNNYFKGIPLIEHIVWHAVKTEELALAIYRFNKSVPVKNMRKLNVNYYINLNADELSWLNDKDQQLYTKLK
jgi:hypothetical protein